MKVRRPNHVSGLSLNKNWAAFLIGPSSSTFKTSRQSFGALLSIWKRDRLGRSLRDLIAMLDDLKNAV